MIMPKRRALKKVNIPYITAGMAMVVLLRNTGLLAIVIARALFCMPTSTESVINFGFLNLSHLPA